MGWVILAVVGVVALLAYLVGWLDGRQQNRR